MLDVLSKHAGSPRARMAKILVVDDDQEMIQMVTTWLEVEHYTVESCCDGEEGLHRLKLLSYDAIILDINMPGMDGLEVCRRFRQSGGNTPILMLTGRSRIAEKETGLDSGADDYLVKPFDMRELLARLRALLRRPRAFQSDLLTIGDISLDTRNFEVSRGGKKVRLLPIDFALLELLMRHPEEIFSNEALLDRVWHSDKDATENALRCSVRRLRQVLDDDGTKSTSRIETIPKIGYRLRGNIVKPEST